MRSLRDNNKIRTQFGAEPVRPQSWRPLNKMVLDSTNDRPILVCSQSKEVLAKKINEQLSVLERNNAEIFKRIVSRQKGTNCITTWAG